MYLIYSKKILKNTTVTGIMPIGEKKVKKERREERKERKEKRREKRERKHTYFP
jgi:hypothetical protein